MFGLFKRKKTYPAYVEIPIPEGCREMTEYEKRFVVNGGGPAMSSQHQAEIAEAYKNGDQGKVDEIMSHYQNNGSGTTSTTPAASGTANTTHPTTSNTAPATATPQAIVPPTTPANTTGTNNNTAPSSSSNNGWTSSSRSGSGSSGSGSGSGDNSSPSSQSPTTTSQHEPSVSVQERYLKAGLSRVEDYKKTARESLGIRGTSPTDNSFKGNIKNKPVSANDYHEYAYYKSMSDCKHEKALDGRRYIPALTMKQQVEMAKHGADGMSISYDKKVGDRKFIPGKQVCKDETKEHCDIYAWNKAVERKLDPSMEKGTLLDLNAVKVNEMYETYYKQYCVPFDSNCAGKNGFLIYDWESNGLGRKDHIEYCEVGAGGDSYTYYKTDGIGLPKAVTYSFSVNPKATALGNSTVVFLPLN